jgi:hypothetical protein
MVVPTIVFTIMVPVMSLKLFIVPVSIMPGGSILRNINSAIPFNIVRPTTIDQDAHPWRCREVAIDADIHIGCRQTREAGKTCLGLIEAQGKGDCCQY